MKLFNTTEWSKFFHAYCDHEIAELKKRNKELENTIPNLLSQVQEQKGILDYVMHEKEQEIQCLKNRNAQLEEWSNQLAIEATKELNGNKPKSMKKKIVKKK